MRVIIIGGKGTAINIAEHIVDSRKRIGEGPEVMGFAIDDSSLGSSINGFPVLCGTHEVLKTFPSTDVKIVFALYRPDAMRARLELFEKLGIPDFRLLTFVHPLAFCSQSVQLGPGTIVLSHSSIQANVRVGRGCIINSNVTVEHDTVMGDGGFIAANACIGANVRIGRSVFIGLTSTVRENVTIADGAFVGMASCVLKDAPADSILFGTPARQKR